MGRWEEHNASFPAGLQATTPICRVNQSVPTSFLIEWDLHKDWVGIRRSILKTEKLRPSRLTYMYNYATSNQQSQGLNSNPLTPNPECFPLDWARGENERWNIFLDRVWGLGFPDRRPIPLLSSGCSGTLEANHSVLYQSWRGRLFQAPRPKDGHILGNKMVLLDQSPPS